VEDKLEEGIFNRGHLLLYELALEMNASFFLYESPTPGLK